MPCDTSGSFRAPGPAVIVLTRRTLVRVQKTGRELMRKIYTARAMRGWRPADRFDRSSSTGNQHHRRRRSAAARDAAAADGQRLLHSRGGEAHQGREPQHQDQLEGGLRRLAAEADLRAQGRAGRHRRHRLRADHLPSRPAAARADLVHDAVRHQRRGDGRQGDRQDARHVPGIPGAIRQVRRDPPRRVELRLLRVVQHLPDAEVRRHQGQENFDGGRRPAMDARHAGDAGQAT